MCYYILSNDLAAGSNYLRKFHIPRPAYKPHSVRATGCTGCPDGHLSGTPVSRRLVQPTRSSKGTSSTLLLLGLAPNGGCLAADITARAGGLLPRRLLAQPLRECCALFMRRILPPFHPRTLTLLTQGVGGVRVHCVSVARSEGFPEWSPVPFPGITRRCALWSADFPLENDSVTFQRPSGQPEDSYLIINTCVFLNPGVGCGGWHHNQQHKPLCPRIGLQPRLYRASKDRKP